MKKMLFFFSLLHITLLTNAQVTFAIQAGVNLATQRVGDPDLGGVSIVSGTKPGITIGVQGRIPFSKVFTFLPAFNFVQKGSTFSDFGTTGTTFRMNYLELPLNVTGNFQAGKGVFFIGGGPVIGLGISGKVEQKDLQSNMSTTLDLVFDGAVEANDNKAHANAFDAGFGLVTGYQLKNGLFFSTGYTFGLINIIPDPESSSLKNNGISFKLGYYFSNAKKK